MAITIKEMSAKFPGKCMCKASFCAGDKIAYDWRAKKVVGCPVCNAAADKAEEARKAELNAAKAIAGLRVGDLIKGLYHGVEFVGVFHDNDWGHLLINFPSNVEGVVVPTVHGTTRHDGIFIHRADRVRSQLSIVRSAE